VSQDRWLKRALLEMGPGPELPGEYHPSEMGGLGLAYFCLVGAAMGVAGVLLQSWRIALAILLSGVMVGMVGGFVLQSRKSRQWVRSTGEKLVFDGPTTARQTLDATLPQMHRVTGLPASDFILEAMAYLEDWAGEHGRASQLYRVALSRILDPPDMRRVGSLVRSIIEALALDGQVDEAVKWLAWGKKYCPTEFDGKDWLTCAILSARQGQVQEALASLQREPDPLSTPLRGQLVAKAVRAFVTGQPEPLPLKEVRYLGSQWPELAAFFDEVERGMGEAGKVRG